MLFNAILLVIIALIIYFAYRPIIKWLDRNEYAGHVKNCRDCVYFTVYEKNHPCNNCYDFNKYRKNKR